MLSSAFATNSFAAVGSLLSEYGVTSWVLGAVLNKLFIYAALAITVGGLAALFTLSRYKDHQAFFMKYLSLGCLLGLASVSVNFFLQVGSFAESGIAGMLDADYVAILWSTGVGESYRFQLVGWCLIALMAILMWLKPAFISLLSTFGMLGAFIIAASFTQTGHTAEAPIWVRIALTLHVVAAMWWMGSLYPLRRACYVLDTSHLQSLMVEFGKQAMFFVGLLLVAGGVVSYHLEGSFSNLLDTAHGNLLMLKLGTVAVILLIAAIHKFRYVPKLRDQESAATLKRSITREMWVGCLILVLTAVMSSVTGPAFG